MRHFKGVKIQPISFFGGKKKKFGIMKECQERKKDSEGCGPKGMFL